jgi:tetratricopeptide (TPR) repeat protein
MGAGTAENEERAARMAAAMNIDIASMMASSAPEKKRSGWMLPTIVGVGLIAMLFVGLGMLRKMAATSGGSGIPSHSVERMPDSDAPDGRLDSAQATADQLEGARRVPTPQAGAPTSGSGDPQFNTRLTQAETMKNAGSWDELARHARTWSEMDSDRVEPLHYLGMAYAQQGNYVQAEEALRRALSKDPQNANVRALLADTYLQANRFAEAAAMYKEMVAASPNDSRLWNNYGAALNGAGQQAQAVAALETAVKLDPSFKQAWTNLGNLYTSMGDQARASAAFANAR